jgi:hypothetical protein
MPLRAKRSLPEIRGSQFRSDGEKDIRLLDGVADRRKMQTCAKGERVLFGENSLSSGRR